MNLDWNVDFDAKRFLGSCTIDFELSSLSPANTTDFIILDTRDLKIHQVKETSSHDKILDFSLEAAHQNFGTALKISLKNLSNINALNSLRLNISYETSSTASALQWLDANLTLGKKYPYLFSQCQAIHARSIMPCQDTPAVKFTYEACVKVVKPLTILMSACSTETIEVDENQTMYKFEQNIKIPSYLLAIVAGHLVSK
jgi:leukotriene-A4 hydrolase